MKIKLTQEKGVEILVATGAIADHELQVLRAGLSQILKTGKNRIILDLPDSPDLSGEVIREIAAFDVLARELSGRIVLSSVSPALQAKIESFARPPTILCYASRAQAVAFFSTPASPVPATGAHAAGADASALAPSEAASLRASASALIARVGALEKENRRLKEQIILTTLERRSPAHESDYIERIEGLEKRLEQALLELAAGRGAVGSGTAAAKKA